MTHTPLVRGTLGLLFLCTGLLHSSQAQGPRKMPPVQVHVVDVTPATVPVSLTTVGLLRSPATAMIAAEASGTVVAVDIPEGRMVTAGHVLVRLDNAEATAALAVATARFQNAKNRRQRARSLRKSQVSSEQALDDAEAAYDIARGELREAETRLDNTVVRAPFAGIAGLRMVNVGQYVMRGTPIVELVQHDPLEFVFSIPQRDATRLRIGQTVHGTLSRCDAAFTVQIDAIAPRIDPTTHQILARAQVANTTGQLRPGMAAYALVEVDTIENAVVVPHDALIRRGTRYSVFTLDAEGAAASRIVTPGMLLPDGVQITAGLSPGDRVVVAGHQKLRPGVTPTVSTYTPIDNPVLTVGWPPAGVTCPTLP